MIEIFRLDNVLWDVVGFLYLRIEIKMGHLSKRCVLSGTGLMTPALLQRAQNLPVGDIVPWGLLTVNINPCRHGRGNIAGSTSAGSTSIGSTSTVFLSQEKISRVEESDWACELLMDFTFSRSTRTRIALRIFVASALHELSFFFLVLKHLVRLYLLSVSTKNLS